MYWAEAKIDDGKCLAEFITNIIAKHFSSTATAAQIAKARNAEDSKQTVTNPKTDNFIPVIDDVTYDFSELPFKDNEFDKVEKSEFDIRKAQILGVKLGEEKKKVKGIKLHNKKLITTKRDLLDTILVSLHGEVGTDGVRQISALFDKLE